MSGGMVLKRQNVQLSAYADGSRVDYTVTNGGAELGRFTRFIPPELQDLYLEVTVDLYSSFFSKLSEVSHV